MKNQLNALAAGLTTGVFWGMSLLIGTWVAMQWTYGASFLEIFTGAYPGYELTAMGSVIGLFWGFIDGFLGGYILVWLYNFFARKLSK